MVFGDLAYIRDIYPSWRDVRMEGEANGMAGHCFHNKPVYYLRRDRLYGECSYDHDVRNSRLGRRNEK